jgi:hypothetical protein
VDRWSGQRRGRAARRPRSAIEKTPCSAVALGSADPVPKRVASKSACAEGREADGGGRRRCTTCRRRCVIRAATAHDIPAIQSIYAHHVLHGLGTFEAEPPDAAEMRARFDAITASGFPYLVAEGLTGRVIGYAYANLFRTRAAYRYTVEDSIYLAPDAMGRASASRYCSSWSRIAPRWGCARCSRSSGTRPTPVRSAYTAPAASCTSER